ncbi:unnamed protein product [Phytophthora lilii]|uniref:Unnamed protein product n=1 Tax=Phytophthora lilii TaxID=2077276 RepID=A0A9W6X8Z3_9STRA|nr:unnamed protein product [Phytophthora lilii]
MSAQTFGDRTWQVARRNDMQVKWLRFRYHALIKNNEPKTSTTHSNRLGECNANLEWSRPLLHISLISAFTSSSNFDIASCPICLMLQLLVLYAVVFAVAETQAQHALTLTAHHPSVPCEDPPSYVKIENTSRCDEVSCSESDRMIGGARSTTCASRSEYYSNIDILLGDTPYILREIFANDDCSDFRFAEVFKVSDKCEQYDESGLYVKVHLPANSWVSVHFFLEATCSPSSLYRIESVSNEGSTAHSCDSNFQRWYARNGNTRSLAWVIVTSDSSGVNGSDTSIIGGVATASSTLEPADDTGFTLDTETTMPTASNTADTTTSLDEATDGTALETEDTAAPTAEPTSSEGSTTTTSTAAALSSRSRDVSSISASDSTSGGSTMSERDPDSSNSLAASTVIASTNGSDESESDSAKSAVSSSTKARKSRVSIETTAPALDSTSASFSAASSESGSTQENIAADDNASASDATTTSKASIGAVTIAGIVMGNLAVAVLIIGSIVHRRRSDDDDVQSPLPNNSCRRTSGPYWGQTSPIHRQLYSEPRYSEQRYADSLASRPGSFQRVSSGQTGLWNDDVITARRIPRDKVHVQHLLSRGAFGEVYSGLYKQERVAIKMLLPQMRGVIQQVNTFLAEAKMTSTMEHPRIVSFVGVAWDSLSDICVVLEYMDGGDLRSLLTNYEATGHPVGFNREKVTIALQVCHALAYMHSLSPPVIHRDLKSRNVLLNQGLEAKLTDFGISRERLDRTMTAGVGTSLWMAPEVMMGNKYDDKADIFSFGVVLSELDVHTLPYAKAMATATANNQMACAVMLQKVAMGTLRVEFSKVGSRAMVELGCACVSVYPDERPTAAEILYKLQTILNCELPNADVEVVLRTVSAPHTSVPHEVGMSLGWCKEAPVSFSRLAHRLTSSDAEQTMIWLATLCAAVIVLGQIQSICAADSSYKVTSYFSDAECGTAPLNAVIDPVETCTGNGCMKEYGAVNTVSCSSDYKTELQSIFDGSAFLVEET